VRVTARIATPGKNRTINHSDSRSRWASVRSSRAAALDRIAADAETGDRRDHTDLHQQRDQIFLHVVILSAWALGV